MTSSVREPGMPITVSRNSPSTNIRPPTDLETQLDEERRHPVEVRDGDADMVENVVGVTRGSSCNSVMPKETHVRENPALLTPGVPRPCHAAGN